MAAIQSLKKSCYVGSQSDEALLYAIMAKLKFNNKRIYIRELVVTSLIGCNKLFIFNFFDAL